MPVPEVSSWSMKALAATSVPIALSVGLAGALANELGGSVTPKEGWTDQIWLRLQLMLVLAVLIERSVEVWLGLTGQNGPDRFTDRGRLEIAAGKKSAALEAHAASLTLGVLVSLAGVRLLDSVAATGETAGWPARVIWFGIDVVLSGGLMAGGAALIHEVAETIRGGLKRLARTTLTDGMGAAGPAVSMSRVAAVAVERFHITVTRLRRDEGRLDFSGGGIEVSTTCWWNPDRRIAARTYLECSKTRMATRTDSVTGERRPGIFLPTAVAPDTGQSTIFIHEGKNASWSDGCIVINRDEMMRLWNAISPEDARNVTIEVRDA